MPFHFFKRFLGTRYKLSYSMLTLFLKNSQDYVVKLSHFGQLMPKKSPELLSYCGQKPLLIKIRDIPNLQIQRMDKSHRICHWQSW